jgi:hypothetical protein
MSELHPVEAGWRKYRNIRNTLDLLAQCFEQREAYLRFLRLPEFPPEVVLPMPLVEPFVRQRSNKLQLDAFGISTLILSAHVWAAYRESKTIYEIEPSLMACLENTPWPLETPAAALVLRSRCPILGLPREGQPTQYVAATYDYQVPNPNCPGILMLHLSLFTEALWIPCGTLNLVGDDFTACARAAIPFVLDFEDLPPLTKEPEWYHKLNAIVLTVLLYLAGDPDIGRVVHPGEKPQIKPTLQKRDPDRYRDLREPQIHAVGKSFTRAIEHWEIERAKGTGDVSGQTVRPHMRRAHAHLYWTGEGRKSPRVRFLLPISVKGGKLIEEPEIPRVTAIR